MKRYDKIKLKMDAIWKARDNEVGAIKERSLLVWGFLMFCYSGYAYLAAKVLNSDNGKLCDRHLAVINMALLVLSLIAFRLSLNWVRMMKGAVAWAQNFDYLAECFQHLFLPLLTRQRKCPYFQPRVLTPSEAATLDEIKRSRNCKECQGDPSYACIFSVTDPTSGYYPDIDENALTTKAGAYSPAKVTIAIARMSLIFSLLLCLAHFAVAWRGIEYSRNFVLQHKDWSKWCAFGAFVLIAGFPFLHLLSRIRAISWILDILLMNDTRSVGLHDIKRIRDIYAPKGGAK